MYRIFDAPIDSNAAELASTPLIAICCTGIVNPFGPTFSAIAIAGDPSRNTTLPLICLSLNPFHQTYRVIGQWVGSAANDLLEGADAWVPFLRGTCPSLLMFHRAVQAVAKSVGGDLLAQCDHYETTKNAIAANLGDPWTRVQREMDGADWPPAPMSPEEFAWMLLGSNHVNPEVQALLYAWNGAIELQRSENPGIADSAMPAAEFTQLLLQLTRDSRREIDDQSAPEPPPVGAAAALDIERFLQEEAYRKKFRPEAHAAAFERLLVAYGSEEDERRDEYLPSIYAELVEGATSQVRQSMLNRLMAQIERRETGARVLLPFLMMDPDPIVASTAALGLSVLSNADTQYVSDGFREIVSAWDNASFANRGAVLGGVLLLGDARFLKHFVKRRKSLSLLEMNETAKCQSSFMLSQTIDFYLDWADELVDRRDNEGLGMFGAVMSALVLVVRSAGTDIVVDEERAVPAMSAPNPINILKRWTRSEFADRIAPRLHALEAREGEPKITPTVRTAWQIPGRPSLLQRLTGVVARTKSKH